MLPLFSESAVNGYLESIGSSPAQIHSFHNELETDWLLAFQARFTLTQSAVELLNTFPLDGKSALLEALAIACRWSSRADVDLPIPMEVHGFAMSQPVGVKDFPVEYKIKAEGGTYYDSSGSLRFKVKKVSVEARVSLC